MIFRVFIQAPNIRLTKLNDDMNRCIETETLGRLSEDRIMALSSVPSMCLGFLNDLYDFATYGKIIIRVQINRLVII